MSEILQIMGVRTSGELLHWIRRWSFPAAFFIPKNPFVFHRLFWRCPGSCRRLCIITWRRERYKKIWKRRIIEPAWKETDFLIPYPSANDWKTLAHGSILSGKFMYLSPARQRGSVLTEYANNVEKLRDIHYLSNR